MRLGAAPVGAREPGSLRRPDRAVRARGPREPRPGHVTPLPHARAAARGPGATLGRLSAPTCPAPSAAPRDGGRSQAGTRPGFPIWFPAGSRTAPGAPRQGRVLTAAMRGQPQGRRWTAHLGVLRPERPSSFRLGPARDPRTAPQTQSTPGGGRVEAGSKGDWWRPAKSRRPSIPPAASATLGRTPRPNPFLRGVG